MNLPQARHFLRALNDPEELGWAAPEDIRTDARQLLEAEPEEVSVFLLKLSKAQWLPEIAQRAKELLHERA